MAVGLVFWPAARCLKARTGWTCALAERSVSVAGVQPRVGPSDLKGALPGQGRVPFFYEFFFDASRVLKRIQYADFPCLH